MRLHLKKKKVTKRAGGVAQGVGPEFKPQCHKKINSYSILVSFFYSEKSACSFCK
jgi:hypothetical protein